MDDNLDEKNNAALIDLLTETMHGLRAEAAYVKRQIAWYRTHDARSCCHVWGVNSENTKRTCMVCLVTRDV